MGILQTYKQSELGLKGQTPQRTPKPAHVKDSISGPGGEELVYDSRLDLNGTTPETYLEKLHREEE